MRALTQRVIALGAIAGLVAIALLPAATFGGKPGTSHREPQVSAAAHHDVSPPLRSLRAAPEPVGGHHAYPAKHLPRTAPESGVASPRTAAPLAPIAPSAPTAGVNFDGIGQGIGGFSVNSAPPDTAGDVGPNHYVQVVNSAFAVFDKSTGALLYGPMPTNTLWSGFGGGCETNNDGDGAAIWDPMADRWMIEQFSVTGANGTTTPFLLCVAVSQTPDPTGAYYRYSFGYTGFPDYPKLGVWPDGYYATFNMFNAAGTTFLGAKACAFDRANMLAGQAATQQCFDTTTAGAGLLPADLDGARLPPVGSPEYLVALGASANSLAYWDFHVDWTTPANSTFTGPTTLATAAFSQPCGSTGTCIPQSGTSQQLDSLADRLMYRLAYRNFGDHEALVVNHTVTAGSSVGARWYELRPGASYDLSVFQQGTYAPDSSYRWMGSIAMDQSGDIALGFSVSSSTTKPSIHYTGRLAGDALGGMTQGENTMVTGTGSQSTNLSRWGDYSAMTVDPVDDCTFWYTNEFLRSNGTINWNTRIGSFKFPSCGPPGPNDFSIGSSPVSLSIAPGSSGTSTISTALVSGSAETVTLAASGLPAGVTAGFSPATVAAGGSSTLTLTAAASATNSSSTVTITGSASSATHTTSVALTVTAPPPPDFTISASPVSLSIAPGSSGTSTISTALVSGSAETVTLAASGLPAGVTAGFSPATVAAGGSSTLTLTAAASATNSSSTVTITGSASSATHTTSVALTVTAPPPPDFTISASPVSLSIAQGASGTSAISTTAVGGTGTVGLNASVSPSDPGVTVSLSAASVAAGSGSTLTVTVAPSAPIQPYTVTVTGTEGIATHSSTVSLTVTAFLSNGGFEAGSLTGWTSVGTTSVVSSGAHGGTYAARVGGTSQTNGDSSITRTFIAPTGTTQLSFWYKVICPDTVTYDWARASLKDNTAGTTATLLAKTCTNTGAWVQRIGAVTAGHKYTLTMVSHDDNFAGDATYTLYDDVTLGSPPPAPSGITNGGFETGSFAAWTGAGTTSVVGSGAHSGTYAARIGSTSPTNGNSSITQTFAAPTGTSQLSFWYAIHCPDTLTYDWATATLKDNTVGTTTTALTKTCTNTGAWVQKSVAVTVGHSYTLTLISHDDNYAGDATYAFYDDVALQ